MPRKGRGNSPFMEEDGMETGMGVTTRRLWSPVFISIVLAALFTSGGCYGLTNAIPLYIDSIGGSASVSGVLTTGFGLAGAVGRIFGGNLSDRIGRRKVMLIGAAVFTVSTLLPAFLPGVELLLLFRVLNGVAFAFVTTAAAAAAADVLPEERMGEGIGYFGLAQSLAIALGPPIAIGLFRLGGRALFVGEGTMIFFTFILMWFCRYEKNAPRPAAPPPAEEHAQVGFLWKILEKTAIWPSVMFFVFSFSCVVLISFAALYAEKQDYRYPGLFYIVQAGTMILARLTAGRLIDRHSRRTVLLPTVLCGVVSFLMLLFSQSEIVFYLSGVLYGFCVGMIFPLLLTSGMKGAPQGRVGAATATLYLFSDAGFAIGASVWGMVIDSAAGYPACFIGGAAGLALTGIIGALTLKDKSAVKCG